MSTPITVRASSLRPTDLILVERYGKTYKFCVMSVEFLRNAKPKKVVAVLNDGEKDARVTIPWDRRHQVIRNGSFNYSDLKSQMWTLDHRGIHKATYMDQVSMSVQWDQESCAYWVEVSATEKSGTEYYKKQVRWSGENSNLESAKFEAELQAVAVMRAWEAFQIPLEGPSKPSEPKTEAPTPTTPTPAIPEPSGKVAALIAEAREEFIAKVRKIIREG